MKVEAPSTAQANALRRANGHTAAPGFSLPAMEAGNQANIRPTNNSAAIANVGSLLALQNIDATDERKRRATRRANSILDRLEDIKIATLEGNVTKAQLLNLSNALKEKIDNIDDINLAQVLEEIELRAEVELAKLERAMG